MDAAAPKTPTTRRRPVAFIALTLLFLAIGAYWTWDYFNVGQYKESTDNAYVNGDQVQISPQQPGTVLKLLADENQYVLAGEVLIELDPADAEIQIASAKAELARAVRDVSALSASSSSLEAQQSLREAELNRAQEDAKRTAADYQRRAALAGSGAVSAEEVARSKSAMDAAKAQVDAAQSALVAASQQLSSTLAQLEDGDIDTNPNVLRAKATLQTALLALSRTTIRAPLSGYVAKRSVHVGMRVAPGNSLMTVVPLSSVWVDANFKEAQLENLRLGQAVSLTADVYGTDVIYRGIVDGIGAGTGGAFALLPPQNATGNWIKVVQRVPVRIRLNQQDVGAHPLRIGLSMHATVDTQNRSGSQLGTIERKTVTTLGVGTVSDQAQQMADQIIKGNGE